ncbi:unnamed protein product [Cylicocyclus nassatus]|uniref:Uncharacterized protein n=1 Tax=Cylicocyclus nassatus TaxID=53992 RepID=A0AA36M707_CYLNA|nr:unnamed protein product [Cylicocyclus nassatus]
MVLKSLAILCTLFYAHEAAGRRPKEDKFHSGVDLYFALKRYNEVAEVRVLPGQKAEVLEGSLVYFPDDGADAWVRVVAGAVDVSMNTTRKEHAVNCLTRPMWKERYGKQCRGFLSRRRGNKNRKVRKVVLISKAGLIMENVQNDDSGLYRPAHIREVAEVRVLPGQKAEVMEGSLVYFPDDGADAWVRVVAGVVDVSMNRTRKEHAVNCLTRPMWQERYGKQCRGFLPKRKPKRNQKRNPRKVVLINKAGLIMENVQNEDSGLYRPAHIRDGRYRLKKGKIYALHVFVQAEFD